MTDLVVREALVDDIPVLWNLLASRSDNPQAFARRAKDKMASADHFIAIALFKEEAVGYAWAQDYGPHLRDGEKIARFHDLIVAEPMRRKGIGRQLFEAVKSWARARGVRELQWQASPTAVGFYDRLGLRGDPCPQPDHPYYEIEFSRE